MTFWAIGKMKNITQRINLKDYGQKLKNYMGQNISSSLETKPEVQIKCKDFSEIQKQKLSEQQWMTIQLKQYKILTQLQQQLMRQFEQNQQKEFINKQKELDMQLQTLIQQQDCQKDKLQKQKLKLDLVSGKKKIEDIITENFIIVEKIQQRRQGIAKN